MGGNSTTPVADPKAILEAAKVEAAQRAQTEAEQVRQRMLESWGALHRVCKHISAIGPVDTVGLRDAIDFLNQAHPGWRDWPGGA